MRALVWYALSLLGRSQAFLAPLLLFLTALVVLTSNGFGPVGEAYAACALVQLVCMTWLTIALLNTEDPVQRMMTTVNAGGGRRVLWANVLAGALICLLLVAVGLGYPIVAGNYAVTVPAVVAGALAQVTCGAVGIAIGLLCCRQVVPRTGYAVLLAVVLVGLLLVVRGLPPVGPVLTLLSTDNAPVELLAPLAGWTAVAVAMLFASFVAVDTLSRDKG